MNAETIISVITCALLIVGLVLLYKKGYLNDKAVSKLAETVKELPKDYGNSFVNALRWYCQLAVDAVDQLVRNGTVEKDNDIRKDWALDIVEKFAILDGKELNGEQIDAADTMIESILGQEHKQYNPVINAQHIGTFFATKSEEAEEAQSKADDAIDPGFYAKQEAEDAAEEAHED